MAANNASNYLVGYKKPPRDTQFKPGQSGNIHGRPKKTPTFVDILEKELAATATIIKKNGKSRKISMRDAIVKQLVGQAAKGDMKATAMFLRLLTLLELDQGNKVAELLQEFRMRDALYAAADEGRTPAIEANESREGQNDKETQNAQS
jgi:hypothetical protein